MQKVRVAHSGDRNELAEMRLLLWPEGSIEEHMKELDAVIGYGMSGTLPAVILVSQEEDGSLIGFLEAGLRSHADGCDPAQPVGFVEGWFVHGTHRNRGVGRELMSAAESWARALGCREIASDTQIENLESQRVHQALGFEVADRCIHFRKSL